MTIQVPGMPPTAPPPYAYITFSAEIDVSTTEQLLGVMANIANQNIPEVHLLLSTPGGSVMHGFNIYNVLIGMPFKLITHNVGNVDSIGNAIFLAGEERYACEHSTFMFHGVAWTAPGLPIDAKTTKERLESILADQQRIAAVVSDRSSLSTAEVDAFYSEARTMTASDAKDAGLVHDVRDVKIPPDAAVANLVFNR